jgi:hypothetical protein
VDERAVAAHQQHQGAADVHGEQGHGDGGDDTPDDERVPLPLPDGAEEAQGMMAEVLDLAAGEREAAGVEEMDAQLDEGDKEQQVERRGGVNADLGGDLVEAEGPGEQDDQQRGKPDRGVDADDDAEGETPGETAWRDAAAQLTQERTQDAAAKELADRFGEEHVRMVRPSAS